MNDPLTEEQLLDLVREDLETEAGDDGIGPYEFWGQRCSDSRPYVAVIECDVDVDVTDYPHEEGDLPDFARGTVAHDDDQEAGFTLALVRVTEKDGRAIATYRVAED